jgi:MFS family permease
VSNSLFYRWFAWWLAASFMAFQFVIRVSIGLTGEEIRKKFGVDASDFGYFSSVYYMGYAGMQIPLAMMLDKWNPRFLIPIFICMCIGGALPLLYGNSWALALAGRFLTGMGCAIGFLGTVRVIRGLFPENQLGFMISLTISYSLLGAVYGGKPVSYLMTQYGWETVLFNIILCGLALALVIFSILRVKSIKEDGVEQASVIEGLKYILKTPSLFILAISGALMVGTLPIIGDIWGVPFISKQFEFSKDDSAMFTSLIYIGFIIGSPIVAYIANKLKSCAYGIIICGLVMGSVGFALVYCTELSKLSLLVLMSASGIGCAYQTLVFSLAAKYVPFRLSGISISLVNCINMFTASLYQILIGYIVEWSWDGTMSDGVAMYGVESYRNAILGVAIGAIIGVLGMLLMPKKDPVGQ